MKTLLAVLSALAFAACSSTERTTGNPSAVRRITISHSGSIGAQQGSTMGAELGQRALKRGVSAALGAAKLGWAGDIIDLAGGVTTPGKKQAGMSQTFRQQCLLGGTDPVAVVAQALERSVRRSGTFTLDPVSPEGTIVLTFTSADMATPAGDAVGLSAQPVISVTARMVDPKGRTIWQRTATGTGKAHPWREYGARPALFRSELSAAAAQAAASLAAQLTVAR